MLLRTSQPPIRGTQGNWSCTTRPRVSCCCVIRWTFVPFQWFQRSLLLRWCLRPWSRGISVSTTGNQLSDQCPMMPSHGIEGHPTCKRDCHWRPTSYLNMLPVSKAYLFGLFHGLHSPSSFQSSLTLCLPLFFWSSRYRNTTLATSGRRKRAI